MSVAVESARKNFAEDLNVLIVQGDILRSPFRSGVFDGGYSIGVLHHTPEPTKGLNGLAAQLKELQPDAIWTHDEPAAALATNILQFYRGDHRPRIGVVADFRLCL